MAHERDIAILRRAAAAISAANRVVGMQWDDAMAHGKLVGIALALERGEPVADLDVIILHAKRTIILLEEDSE